ncbi:sigma-70 family RNA polymerase sigma factor [SAR92 clade bacterium H455]|uniref:Sigma-70 family RNA polymerase sigma factor n=1 Tax=SAR92 clade bacterium H455 TaxID=2974818 RepID=A0ABY5TLV7_9GAMM|nr:sigma-70 family RNA polymerase sigma factor [SAR92 clade bacterium H455]
MSMFEESLCLSTEEVVHSEPSFTHSENASSTVNKAANITDNIELVNCVARQWDSPLRRYFQRNTRSKCQADVDDLMQDLYCRLFTCRNPGNIESINSFAFTIAQNLLRDRSRRVATRMSDMSTSIDDVAEPFSETTGPERIVESEQALKQILSVIDEWPPARREAFVQHRLCGESHKVVASLLGISVSMVEKHIASARSALRVYTAAI